MRPLLRLLVLLVVGTVASVVGLVAALTLAPPGRALLARNVGAWLGRVVRGSVQVGAVGGSFLRDLDLRRLEVRDEEGVLLAQLPRVRLRYRIPTLTPRRIVLDGVDLERPVINLVRHRGGRWNFEEVLRLGEGKGGGAPIYLEFDDVHLRDGTLAIAYPWPGGDVRGARRDSVIAAARATPGHLVIDTPEGTKRVVTASGLTAVLARLRVSDPDRRPIFLALDSLRADVNDPGVQLRDLKGRAEYANNALTFAFRRAALPGTVASADGRARWPHDTILYDFRARAGQVALADLRFISPDFPAMTGRGTVRALSSSGSHTEYDLRDLALADGAERIEGRLVAITDVRRGLGVRNLELRLTGVDLDKVRPYLDTLPFHGWVTGPVRADGYLTALVAQGEWVFTDAAVPGRPESRFGFAGGFRTGGAQGLTFDSVRVTGGDFDLGTIRNLAPAVLLAGRLAADGVLDGPLHDATFTGVARHQDGARPPSAVRGTMRLDTRGEPVRVAADVELEPLAFAGIRATFPAIRSRGELRGHVRLAGALERMAVEAEVRGEVGDVTAFGTVTLLPPRWGADSLRLAFRALDLAALLDRGPATALDGTLDASGTLDTLVAPAGEVRLRLTGGRVREVQVDSARLALAVRDSLVTVDTADASAGGVRVTGGGTLGWAAPHAGRLRLVLHADSLTGLDSLVRVATGLARDTLPDDVPLDGIVDGRVELLGSLDSLSASASLEARGFHFERVRMPAFQAEARWIGGRRPWAVLSLATDSVSRGPLFLRDASLRVAGPADSVAWAAATSAGPLAGLAASGRLWVRDSLRTFALDSLGLRLPAHAWRLEAPATLALDEPAPAVSPLRLLATDGAGDVAVAGRVPFTGAGALTVEALGLDVRDLAALAQLDTAGLGGELGLRLELGGTRLAPTIRGTWSLEDLRMGDTRGPLAIGALDYADRRLRAGADLWRTGTQVLAMEVDLPLDLAFAPVPARRVEGPLMVRATADSADLAVLEALTPSVRQVAGRLAADVRLEGTWAAPRLAGAVTLAGGAMTIPGLGVRWTGMEGRAELVGDSVRLVRLTLASAGGGRLDADGVLRVGTGGVDVDVGLRADRFRAIQRNDFLDLTASGRLRLAGPLTGMTVTGSARADEGVLYFADLLNKRVIDLDDPENRQFIDTTLIARRNLGEAFQTRLVDGLRVQDLAVEIGNDFWLRSSEANIKLEGRVRANKARAQYRLDGTLSATRGRYTLAIGPVKRDFQVTRGNVRYFGTPDLNAELDIEAQHVVRTTRNEELPVIAKVGGTLLVPSLHLESTRRPPLSETDLVSYLITGTPASEAAALGQGEVVQNAVGAVLAATSSELERALISDLGLPIDMLQIKPGVQQGPQGQTGVGFLSLSAGWQIGRRTWFTFNAGVCPSALGEFNARNLGVGLEYRFSRSWKVQAVVEPAVRFCGATSAAGNLAGTLRYQLGADFLYAREF